MNYARILVSLVTLCGVASTADAQRTPVGQPSGNRAPVLTGGVVSLRSVASDAGSPSGVSGTPVNELVDVVGGGGHDNVIDDDDNAVAGIAITGVDDRFGRWYKTTDNGTTWTLLTTVNSDSAHLLAADPSNRVYFQPDGTFEGVIDQALTFYAWDQTAGQAGSIVSISDTTVSGAVSVTTAVARIEVTPAETPADQDLLAQAPPSDMGLDVLFGPRAYSPPMLGDFFGGGAHSFTVSISESYHVFGTIVSGGPGTSSAVLDFSRASSTAPAEFSTAGNGVDVSGDSQADQFNTTEPVPASINNPAITPEFKYDGGTVVYTDDVDETTPQDGQFMDGEIWFASHRYSKTIEVPGGGATVRRIKIAENNSPVPRNRAYFDYKFFRDVIGPFGDVNRFTFGAEKTFFKGQASLDLRVPFAGTIDNEQTDGTATARSVEFGNMTLIAKQVLYFNQSFLFTGGLGVTVPTGSDGLFLRANRVPILAVNNDAVFVSPYFANLWTPDERFFLQSFLEIDVDVNGNEVLGDEVGGNLAEIGVLQNATLMLADVGAGYWLFRDDRPSRQLRGVAATTELHYNTTLENADAVTSGGLTVTDYTQRLDVFNFTIGTHLEFWNSLTVTTGLTFPLRNGDDRQFDNEVAVLINYHH